MPAFDTGAFDTLAFDAGAPLPINIGAAALGLSVSIYQTGTPAPAGLAVSIVSPLVFDSSAGYVRWAPSVAISGVDVSARLTGRISISAGEDSARIASLDLVPPSVIALQGYEGASITIDVTLFRTGITATYRLFTGTVERQAFAPASRVASLSCRDGYQERPLACTSAADVEALFAGMAYPAPGILPWNAAVPDPAAYFSGLLETFPGAVAIDGNGLWHATPWAISTPAASFTAGEIFDESITLKTAARADLPSDIHAALVVRGARLHAAEVALTWTEPNFSNYILDGIPALPKSTLQSALSGIREWVAKGAPVITSPTPGTYGPIGGAYHIVTEEGARVLAHSFSGTYYRRWYQQIEYEYTVTIPMGGTSNRDDSIRASLVSTFDAGAWESAPSAESGTSLYSANAPTPAVPPTGYEGLPTPWPPVNGAVDHLPDLTAPELQAAAEHVVARAVRRAAAGRRKRQVGFARPLDPRWEIGAVMAISADGIAAAGQVAELTHDLDLDSGLAESSFTLAVPDGAGSSTGFTASVTAPTPSVAHVLPAPALGNHIGFSTATLPNPPDDSLQGFLCNVLPTGLHYDAAAPAYEPQFRVVMPEVPALHRDPLTLTQPMTASVSIAAGSLAITF